MSANDINRLILVRSSCCIIINDDNSSNKKWRDLPRRASDSCLCSSLTQLRLPDLLVLCVARSRVAVAGRRFDAWPPADATPTTIHFHAGGTLSLAEAAPAPDSAFDEYVSDPAVPVPYIDKIAIGMTRPYMTDDQRFASRRPDVLVYETDVLGAGNIHHNDHCTQGLFFYHTRPFAKTGSGQDRRNDAKKGGVLLSQRRT